MAIGRYRFLMYNHYGRISLTVRPSNSDVNDDVVEEIEISSDIAGPGRRKQTLNNTTKKYNMASIGNRQNSLERLTFLCSMPCIPLVMATNNVLI